ncbi:MAG: BatD family protein [Myxococcota bacterium]
MRRSRRLAALLVGGWAWGAGAQEDVRIELRPERVFTHAQVELSIEVIHPKWARPRWEAPPFEGFWAERLSTRAEAIGNDRIPLRRTVFRRALFPTRTGELQVSPSVVKFTEPDGRERRLQVPGARLQADPLPESGRPEGFEPIVGQVQLRAELTRDEVVRGRSVRLIVDAYGEANLWDLSVLSLPSITDALEVFPARPRLHVGEREDRLTLRRTFVFDLVPHTEGEIEIPSLSLSYFDPDSGRYRTARSESLALRVHARSSQLASRSPFAPSRDGAPLAGSGRSLIVLWVGACGLAGWFLLAWARRNAARLRRPTRPSRKAALAAARSALGTDRFPRLLGRALRAGIAVRHGIDVENLTAEEIAIRVDDTKAVEMLLALDRMRFASRYSSPESLLESVARYLSE